MGKRIVVKLDEHFSAFVEERVAGGSFESAEAVVYAGLRLLQEEDAKIAALRAAIIEGEESGEPTEFDLDDFLMRKHESYRPK